MQRSIPTNPFFFLSPIALKKLIEALMRKKSTEKPSQEKDSVRFTMGFGEAEEKQETSGQPVGAVPSAVVPSTHDGGLQQTTGEQKQSDETEEKQKPIVSLCLVVDDSKQVRGPKVRQIKGLLDEAMLAHPYYGFAFGADNAATAEIALETMKNLIEKYKDEVVFIVVVLTDRNFFLTTEDDSSRSVNDQGEAETIVLKAYRNIPSCAAKVLMSISSKYSATSDDQQCSQPGDGVERPVGMMTQLLKNEPLKMSKRQILTHLIRALEALSVRSTGDDTQAAQPNDSDMQPPGYEKPAQWMSERDITTLLPSVLKKLSGKPSPSSQSFDVSVVEEAMGKVEYLNRFSKKVRVRSNGSFLRNPQKEALTRTQSDGYNLNAEKREPDVQSLLLRR